MAKESVRLNWSDLGILEDLKTLKAKDFKAKYNISDPVFYARRNKYFPKEFPKNAERVAMGAKGGAKKAGEGGARTKRPYNKIKAAATKLAKKQAAEAAGDGPAAATGADNVLTYDSVTQTITVGKISLTCLEPVTAIAANGVTMQLL